MQYPVSAQYAPLAGFARFKSGKAVARQEKPKAAIIRTVFEMSTKDQILAAIRQLDGPTWTEIHKLCGKEVTGKNLRSELARMCKTSIIRAVGDKRPHRYYENVRKSDV